MKKTILLVLAAGLFAACGTNKNGAAIEGTVAGLEDGANVYLLDINREKLDSTLVADGKFRFEVANAYPDVRVLAFENNPGFSFIVEPGTITADVNFENGELARFEQAVFTGTETNDRIKNLNDRRAAYLKQLNELGPKLSAMDREGKNDTPEFDSLMNIYREADKQYGETSLRVLSDHPNTIFAAYMQSGRAHSLSTPEMVDSVLNGLAETPPNVFTDRLKERREILARTAIGRTAPDFTQNRPDGTPFTLSSLKGKLVLIDFWASWCGPCRAENPNVVKIYDRFRDKGFEIVGVSLDAEREDWLKGIEEDGLTWIHVSDLQFWNNAVAKEYAVSSIPHTVLVGPDGVILAKNLRGEKLEQKIAEVLGE